jgi:hypothetical protein
MGDGSVRMLSQTVSLTTLLRLACIGDGQIITEE